jgi:hypothetical protein
VLDSERLIGGNPPSTLPPFDRDVFSRPRRLQSVPLTTDGAGSRPLSRRLLWPQREETTMTRDVSQKQAMKILGDGATVRRLGLLVARHSVRREAECLPHRTSPLPVQSLAGMAGEVFAPSSFKHCCLLDALLRLSSVAEWPRTTLPSAEATPWPALRPTSLLPVGWVNRCCWG